MTPLALLLGRLLPRALVAPALVIIYAAMMLGLVLVGAASQIDNAYINVNRH